MSSVFERFVKLSAAQRQLFVERSREKKTNWQLNEPIAIIGMGCRFPGAANPDDFWRLICEKRDATSEVPGERWPVDVFYDPDPDAPGKMAVRWGAFLDDFDKFDAIFFGITPREAARMDPQQRQLLEVAWESLEDAAVIPERLSGSATGVFIGVGQTDYAKIQAQYENCLDYIDAHSGTGNALSIAANRLSYILNLRGPSMSIDTACSSALVALHSAVQALRDHECELALAGAVNMVLTPDTMIALSKARMLSTDGRCRPFDAGANGYVRGEGCGVVVLKRLSDALIAGDRVLAVVRHSAVNHVGRTSGITAPNGSAQKAVIRAAMAGAGVTPEMITYLEAHGTGTPLGDPIEAQALGEIFRRATDQDALCHLASVKANIGHLEIAAGMAGLIKVILMMRHGWIPPQAHLEKLNPHISLEGTRLVIPSEGLEWDTSGGPRIAGVSAFGFGGTCAHAILEAAGQNHVDRSLRDRQIESRRDSSTWGLVAERTEDRDTPPSDNDRPCHVFTISAKSKPALQLQADRYRQVIEAGNGDALADVCYSVNSGRSHFTHRAVIVPESREKLCEQLAALAEGKEAPGVSVAQTRVAARPNIAMVFTGQGSQYAGMGPDAVRHPAHLPPNASKV